MDDYNIGHNELIKWTYEGSLYCLHVQNDDDPAISPIKKETIIQMPCWGRKAGLGNVNTRGMDPDDYWRRLVRKHVPDADVLRPALDGKLGYVKAVALGGGLYDVNGKTDGTVLCESEHEDVAADAVVDEMTVPECRAALEDHVFAMPVFCYDHGGITISCDSTYPYNDEFDGGQIGWATLDKDTVLQNWPCQDDWKAEAEKAIRSFVKTYDLYLTGDVWYFMLNRKDPGTGKWEELESCGGFLGSGVLASGMAENAGHGLEEAIKSGDFETGKAREVVIRYYDYD